MYEFMFPVRDSCDMLLIVASMINTECKKGAGLSDWDDSENYSLITGTTGQMYNSTRWQHERAS